MAMELKAGVLRRSSFITHLAHDEEDDGHCCARQGDEHQELEPKNQPLCGEKCHWSH